MIFQTINKPRIYKPRHSLKNRQQSRPHDSSLRFERLEQRLCLTVFFDFEIIAQTGQNGITDIGTAVSINGVSVIARGVVVAIAGDDVTEVKITSSGIYTSLPGTTDVATTNASGIGDDLLTVDLTTQAAQWTQDRSTFVDLTTDYEWIASSVKTSNAPTMPSS